MDNEKTIVINNKEYSFSGWIIAALICVILFLGSWMVWTDYFKKEQAVGTTQEATPAKEIAAVPTTATPVEGGNVETYPDAVKKVLKLPENIVSSKNKQVVASIKVKADDHPHTVTTVVDVSTGTFESFDRRDPLPWAAYSSKGSVGAYYGFKSGESAIRLVVRQELLQVKAVKIGVTLSLDRTMSGNTSSFVGIGAEYNWK